MSRIHTQMSVPGVSKCHRVQTFLVIGVTITLVTSCWMRVLSLPQLFRKQPTTRRYYPGLIITPLLQGRPGIWLPLRHCLYLPNFLDYELTADRQATLSQAAPSMAAQAAPSMAVLPCCWRCFSYRGSGAVSWCRGEAVASHHFGERYGVRRAASCGLDHGGHLAEVVRAEDAGADDREHLRRPPDRCRSGGRLPEECRAPRPGRLRSVLHRPSRSACPQARRSSPRNGHGCARWALWLRLGRRTRRLRRNLPRPRPLAGIGSPADRS